MNDTAFTQLTGLIDEAIELASDAVKEAETTAAEPEEVKLVKVAASRYEEAARELIKTGSFKEHSVESLTNTLKNAGTAEFLGLMEKLASSAVFPLDADDALGGDLVEKPATYRADGSQPGKRASSTDVWFEACQDAGLAMGD